MMEITKEIIYTRDYMEGTIHIGRSYPLDDGPDHPIPNDRVMDLIERAIERSLSEEFKNKFPDWRSSITWIISPVLETITRKKTTMRDMMTMTSQEIADEMNDFQHSHDGISPHTQACVDADRGGHAHMLGRLRSLSEGAKREDQG